MHVKTISLKNFRNFQDMTIDLSDSVNIFYGDNAQGKTNLLESIHFCATGRSQRTHVDKELICFDKTYAHAQVLVHREHTFDRIDLHLKKDMKKAIAVNGVPVKKLSDLFGILRVVIFSPEDLNLIKAGPGERRKYIDMQLCQLSSLYYYDLQQYYKILKQRNTLLKKIQKDKTLQQSLFVWDEQLTKHGMKIIYHRQQFINKINTIAEQIHSSITNSKEKLNIQYQYNVTAENFAMKLRRALNKDIMLGNTSVGIHKDDISFFINKREVKIYGSQGQQRTASLSAKLAQINIVKEDTDEYPVLLLDDVLSELDESRQKFLIESIRYVQTIITCTGVEDVINKFNSDVSIFNVSDGIVNKLLNYNNQNL